LPSLRPEKAIPLTLSAFPPLDLLGLTTTLRFGLAPFCSTLRPPPPNTVIEDSTDYSIPPSVPDINPRFLTPRNQFNSPEKLGPTYSRSQFLLSPSRYLSWFRPPFNRSPVSRHSFYHQPVFRDKDRHAVTLWTSLSLLPLSV